jgi:hypothetical protein
MKSILTMTTTMSAVLSSTVLLLSFVATSIAFAQDEEYMQEHDGGDRVEYLQETEHVDPMFYVPPVNDVGFPVANNSSAN